MQFDHQAQKVLICGSSGCGKSLFFTRFLHASPHNYKFVYDHEGELSERLGVQPARTMEDFERWEKTPQPRFIFDPSELYPGNIQEGWDFFSEWTFSISSALPGTKLVCCDELQKLVTPQKSSFEMNCLLETGRRRGLDLALVSQQPNIIHNRTRAQMTEIVAFRQIEPVARQWLVDCGFDENEIAALPDLSWIHRDMRTGEFIRGKISLSGL